jgi:hypothetical protein
MALQAHHRRIASPGANNLRNPARITFHVPPDLCPQFYNTGSESTNRRESHQLTAVSQSFESSQMTSTEPLIIECDTYRPNVGMCVVNKKGLVFAAR